MAVYLDRAVQRTPGHSVGGVSCTDVLWHPELSILAAAFKDDQKDADGTIQFYNEEVLYRSLVSSRRTSADELLVRSAGQLARRCGVAAIGGGGVSGVAPLPARAGGWVAERGDCLLRRSHAELQRAVVHAQSAPDLSAVEQERAETDIM